MRQDPMAPAREKLRKRHDRQRMREVLLDMEADTVIHLPDTTGKTTLAWKSQGVQIEGILGRVYAFRQLGEELCIIRLR